MPALGHNGYLVMVKESAWGTDPGSGYTSQSIMSESLDVKKSYEFTKPIVASRFAPPFKVPMGITAGGAINFDGDVEGILGLCLKGILSAETTTDNGSGNGGLHVFIPENAVSPSFSCVVSRDTTPSASNIWGYVGGTVDKLSLSAAADGLLKATAQMSFKTGASAAAAVTPSYTTQNPLVFHTGSITIAGSSVNVRSFKLDIDSGNHNRRPALATQFTQQQQPGLFNVTGEIEAYFDSLSQVNAYLAATDVAIILELDGTAVGTSTRKLILTIPVAQFTSGVPQNTGAANELMLKLPFQAWLSGAGSPNVLVQASLLNSKRTAY